MAYTALDLADIASGKPAKEEIFTQIRTNQEDFDTKISLLTGTAKISVFDVLISGGVKDYSVAEIQSRSPIFVAPTAATLVSFVITLLETSTSGTLGIDLEKSTDNGVNWNTLLTSDVQVTTFAIGDQSGTVNWINAAAQDYNQNDMLRFKITGIQNGQQNFHVSVYSEAS